MATDHAANLKALIRTVANVRKARAMQAVAQPMADDEGEALPPAEEKR